MQTSGTPQAKPRRRPLDAGRVTVCEPAAGSSAAAVRPAVSPGLWCHGPVPGGMPWPDGLMLLSWSAGWDHRPAATGGSRGKCRPGCGARWQGSSGRWPCGPRSCWLELGSRW